MEMIRNCGWMGFLVLLLALIGIVIGIAALAVALLARRFGVAMAVIAMVAAILPPTAGLIGTVRGRQVVEGAISGESVSPEVRGRIRQQGYYEAGQCTSLGALGGVLPGLMSMGALLIAIVRRTSRPAEPTQS